MYRTRTSRRLPPALLSLLLTAVLVCACALPGFAVGGDRLTAQEKQTQTLIADVLEGRPAAVKELQNEHAYKAFLDRVETARAAWVAEDAAHTRTVLKERGISPKQTVAELRASDNEAARQLYKDIKAWLIEADEDSSVLPYASFVSAKDIAGLDLSKLIAWSSLQAFVDTMVPLLLQQALDALSALGIKPVVQLDWPLLDQKAVVDYAHKYAKKYNPAYRVPESGSDCTNFVSQALYAAGLGMRPSSIRGTSPGIRTTTDEWYYYNSPSATASTPYGQAVAVSTSWIRVEDLYTYLAPHYPVFQSTDQAAVAKNLAAGYIIQGGKLLGRFEHSAIVTVKNGKFCYTAHTNDRKDRDMKHYYNAYERFRVLKVCVS
ncbi:MAG: amidase domain-containing protein [Clostridia bacterium]|nr:amidase domain-containing protein [Clostridia bacterium]